MKSALSALALVSLCLPLASAELPDAWRDCPECPWVRVVPGGWFIMGSEGGEPGRPEGPKRAVRIAQAFGLGVYEVTVEQFAAFVAASGYQVASGCRTLAVEGWAPSPQRSWRDPGLGAPPRTDDPVVCVGRDDALAYVTWLSARTGQRYRLPSEAEWEYAARAGSTTDYPWGDAAQAGCAFANLYDRSARVRRDFGWPEADCDDGFAEIAPVGRFISNAFGIHDLIGNVWEWTADCYRELYVDAPVDGSAAEDRGDCQRWSVRGGSWMTRPERNRSAFRGRDPLSARYAYFGFRVARDLRP